MQSSDFPLRSVQNHIRENKMLKKLAFGLLFGSAAAFAQTVTTDIQTDTDGSAYLQDSRGVVVRGSEGLCWRTGHWGAADAMQGCDGPLAPPVVKATAPAIAVAPVPAPATGAAPASAPIASAAPVIAAAPKRCDFAATLSSDQIFASNKAVNKAVLSGAAKKRIDDDVVSRLANCGKIDVVVVTGHTDRLGAQQSDQKLSEKRADAVAAYLKSRGVSAQIKGVGAGKAQPVKTCDDKLGRKKLVACLAPNRRIVIEASGLAQ
jgi:OOP family OmpA-OmpF porin